jgi:hypothetical protein
MIAGGGVVGTCSGGIVAAGTVAGGIVAGGIIAGTSGDAAAGVLLGGETGAGSEVRRGFNRMRLVGSAEAGPPTEDVGSGAPGAAAGVGAAGAAEVGGVSASGGRKRGLRRSEGVGVGSSLIALDQTYFPHQRETKKTLNSPRSSPAGRSGALRGCWGVGQW